MVIGFTSFEGRYLSDSVVDTHEVGILRELGDDFTCAHPLRLTCYCGDRHEALFGGRVHLVGDLVKCSWSGTSAHDGSVASSHAMAHGDVEFELEADPDSKSVYWL
jgi:hypothetical protein